MTDLNDTVITVDEDDLNKLRRSSRVNKHADGTTWRLVKAGHGPRGPYCLLVTDGVLDALEHGNPVHYDGDKNVSIIHEAYAGTPKSRDAAAERMFELFKQEDGRAKNVAQEALHLLGYEVDVDKEYTLVDKQND